MPKKKLKIYLGGAFSGWRDDVIDSLPKSTVEFHDPRTDTDQSSIHAFTMGDKNGVTSCDAMLAYAQEGRENGPQDSPCRTL